MVAWYQPWLRGTTVAWLHGIVIPQRAYCNHVFDVDILKGKYVKLEITNQKEKRVDPTDI